MTKAAASRGRKIGFALVAALVAALALLRWAGEPPATFPPVAAPSPRITASRRDPLRAAVGPSSVPTPLNAGELNPPTVPPPTEGSSEARPTPSVFDFATMTPAMETAESRDEERFATNESFTEEDLRHPELYFELAEQMPELNRPEERRDTLDFFLAYREKLGRDLEVVGENRDRRQEILAAIERYEAAIARLRELIDAEAAK